MMEAHKTVLEREGFLLLNTKGVSMEPMLHEGREQSLIRPLEGKPKKNDVILFRRKNGALVLHRVVGKRGESFILRGDNCYGSELVPTSQMLGRLEGYYAQDRYVDCSKDRAYKRYVFGRNLSYPLRYFSYGFRAKLSRIFGK